MADERQKNGPVLIELEGPAAHTPASAPPVPEPDLPQAAAMPRAIRLAGRRPSGLLRWFWGLFAGLVGFMASVAAWDFVTGLIARNAYLGYGALALIAAFLSVVLLIGLREWIAFVRLARIDTIRRDGDAALGAGDLGGAKAVAKKIARLYHGRADMRWALSRLAELEPEAVDADALLALAETEVLAPLDQAARGEIEAAARQVAAVTAVVPLALADVAVALAANIRMIRRIAEIYGGRSGFLGSWRLLRAVMGHLVATGAVAVGDDLIGSLAGGGVLSKISRRFGEGVINGTLTARVGVAALDVCRPLAFRAQPRPRVAVVIKRALTGLFGS